MRRLPAVIVWALGVCLLCGVGRADPPEELEKLLQTLESASAEERLQALEGIGNLGGDAQAAIATLVKTLDDSRPETRAAAAIAIGKIGVHDEVAAARLLKAFADEGTLPDGTPICYFAADALGHLGAKSVPQLIPCLSGDNVQVRRCAALALGRIGPESEAAVPALHELLQEDVQATRRISAYALMAIGPASSPAMPTLRKMLPHEDFHAQYWCCRAIAAIGPPAALPAVPALIELLSTGNPSVKRNAADALGRLGPEVGERAVAPLVKLMDDKVHPVRRSAVIALGQLGPTAISSSEAVRAAMNDAQFNNKAEAAGALWQITGRSDPSLDVLLDVLQGKQSPWEAAQAFERLGAAGGPAVARLAELATSENPETQYFAIASLAGIGSEAAAALPALSELLDDTDQDLQALVREAIAKIQASR